MPTKDAADPIAVTTTLVLAASLLMENASAELVLAPDPTKDQLAEKVQFLTDTTAQLHALVRAARAALKQHQQ